jgi:hypothetical protein
MQDLLTRQYFLWTGRHPLALGGGEHKGVDASSPCRRCRASTGRGQVGTDHRTESLVRPAGWQRPMGIWVFHLCLGVEMLRKSKAENIYVPMYSYSISCVSLFNVLLHYGGEGGGGARCG